MSQDTKCKHAFSPMIVLLTLVVPISYIVSRSAVARPSGLLPSGTANSYSTNFSNAQGPLSAGSNWISGKRAALDWADVRVIPGFAFAAPLAALVPTTTANSCSTNFPNTEDPISEGGRWISGKKAGLDWADVRVIPGFAFGTEIGGKRPAPEKYDDSTALVTGTWGPNQTVEATVHRTNKDNDHIYEEVELRLRSSLSPHNCTGYEVMFRCSKSPKAYCNIARWDGLLGAFVMLTEAHGSQYGVADGDVVKATIKADVITVWLNGVQILQTRDYLFKSGNPGIGFYLEGATGVDNQYGFSSFKATSE